MKFTPDNLLQIYLDGSFTEEAQAAFDELMKKDPKFSEKVTQSVAERLGTAPGMRIDDIASHLDSKIDAIWEQYKPSPWMSFFRSFRPLLIIAAVVGLLYVGFRINTSSKATSDLPVTSPAVTGMNSAVTGLDQSGTIQKTAEQVQKTANFTPIIKKTAVRKVKHHVLSGMKARLKAKAKTTLKSKITGYREMGSANHSMAAPLDNGIVGSVLVAKLNSPSLPSQGAGTSSNNSLLVFQTPSAGPPPRQDPCSRSTPTRGFPLSCPSRWQIPCRARSKFIMPPGI